SSLLPPPPTSPLSPYTTLFRSHLRMLSAGLPGLEPRLNEPESLVLPITPEPNVFQGHPRGDFPEQRDITLHKHPARRQIPEAHFRCDLLNIMGRGRQRL